MTQTRKCPGCGREISAFAARCMYCGRARPARCRECKKITYDGSSYCAHCGAPLPDPARPSKPESANAPAASPAVGDKEYGPPLSANQAPNTVTPGKAALILVVSTLVILFVLYTLFVSRRTKRRTEAAKKVHRLWDRAEALARKGEINAARQTYEDALSSMQRYSVDDPAARMAITRDLEALQPKPEKKETKPKPASAADLKGQGFVIHPPLAFQTKVPTPFFYTGRPCVEVWVKVVNIGKNPVKVSRAALKAHFDDGAELPAADVGDAFLLSERKIAPGETTSGAVLFGALADETPTPEHVKEVTYAEKIIWKRPSPPMQP
ncbi:MAG: hypothetical protein GXP25_02625 [Planctomycetes bacterium]|nr:hypothetical protein [Planctomycetota bacterium]